jgi:hypothetical protein
MTSVSGDQAAVQGQLKSRLSVALKNNGTIDSLKVCQPALDLSEVAGPGSFLSSRKTRPETGC